MAFHAQTVEYSRRFSAIYIGGKFCKTPSNTSFLSFPKGAATRVRWDSLPLPIFINHHDAFTDWWKLSDRVVREYVHLEFKVRQVVWQEKALRQNR